MVLRPAKEMKKKIKEEIYKSNKTDYIWNHMIEKSTFKEIPGPADQ